MAVLQQRQKRHENWAQFLSAFGENLGITIMAGKKLSRRCGKGVQFPLPLLERGNCACFMGRTNNHTALRLSSGKEFCFASPEAGRKNSLLVDTIELFGPRYAREAVLLHLHDPANTIIIHENIRLTEVGIPPMPWELWPDIILYQEQKQLLFFIGISAMSGIISTERKQALERQITVTTLRRIYISAFFERDDYIGATHEIAWRSYVWLAHEPDHMIVHW
jgi:hypothetical protein